MNKHDEYYAYIPEGWTTKTSKMCKDWWDKFFKEKEQPAVIVVKDGVDHLIPQLWAREMLKVLEQHTKLADLICPRKGSHNHKYEETKNV